MNTKRALALVMVVGTAIGLASCQSDQSMNIIPSQQNTSTTKIKADAYMPIGQQVVPPLGYISFCLNDENQCEGGTDTPTNMKLTEARWNELNTINDYVNSSVQQITDADNYGVSERWSYPNAKGGDCEDFVLLKRKMLIERGWSPADLLVTVVREWDGAGHAVLVADTDKGEFVLDNKNWAIVSWKDAPYTWIKRQSRKRPYIWVNLDTRSFRNAANDILPPLGAPIPFVVAANTSHLPTAPKMKIAEAGPAKPEAGKTGTTITAPDLRPSLATGASQAPTATLASSS